MVTYNVAIAVPWMKRHYRVLAIVNLASRYLKAVSWLLCLMFTSTRLLGFFPTYQRPSFCLWVNERPAVEASSGSDRSACPRPIFDMPPFGCKAVGTE